ncbi:MAG: hypothetical protein LLF28_01000 [Nitrospiraceae bacterium]|nr:hypothetical protein [Nitrospiraceae bacterium]
MRISIELAAGLILAIATGYYWYAIGNSMPINDVPLGFRYSYRLFPYADIVFAASGMLLFYRGLQKLKK